MRGVSVLQRWKLGVLLRAVVRAIIGEDGCTIKGAVILREVEPALIANTIGQLTTDTNTNDVSRGIDELLSHRLL